ncbi:hypothetical protein CC78DRAFT_582129 [Lojkania enalia]|uniref:Uncharacterized protein n=1 Tax=Lojkania enalia TaxID=147567 RepID=A0A9P4N2T8_9PLEO|nr:hypothetical protein CC78DRAFT_582129 [Didymosphaeria enalia]
MDSSILTHLLFAATLVLSCIAVPSDLAISDIYLANCPFNVQASFAQNGSYFDVIYNTNGITPNSLAAYGPNVQSTDSKRKCYLSLNINHNTLDVARLRISEIEVQGSARLDEGLIAKVETNLTFASHALMNFTTAAVMGPKSPDSVFTHLANRTSAELHADCRSPKRMTLVNVFSVSAASGTSSSSTTGELVKDSSLRVRFFLKWVDLCDVVSCSFVDRYGNIVYRPPYDAETCQESWK